MLDLRFHTALQVMLSLALAEQMGTGPMSSTQLATRLGPNPSLVRKLLVPLARSGLVRSTRGTHGGVQLGRPPGTITLRDIYLALRKPGTLVGSARPEMPHVCLITATTGRFFRTLSDQAEQAVQDLLGQRTLEQSLAELRGLEAGQAPS